MLRRNAFTAALTVEARRIWLVRYSTACHWLCLLCTVLFFASLSISSAEDSVSKDYQIKAEYVYNFAKFVQWPPETFTNSQSPLVIGVFGQNPFGNGLQAIAKEHKINGRDIVVKPVAAAAEAARVHLIFFAATEDGHIQETLAALKNAGVLTVGETDKFMAAGGIIGFVRDEDKVRFEINTAAANEHGLKISAQLLKLARPVHQSHAIPPQSSH